MAAVDVTRDVIDDSKLMARQAVCALDGVISI